jgi:hypothetical protein
VDMRNPLQQQILELLPVPNRGIYAAATLEPTSAGHPILWVDTKKPIQWTDFGQDICDYAPLDNTFRR